jgi:hypothetical protein
MAKYMNKYGLPVPVFQALTSENYDRHGDYSTTSIIDSPRIFYLTQRHQNEIIIEAMDQHYMLDGNALHYLLEQVDHPRAMTEERFIYTVDGCQLSMKADLLWPEDVKKNVWTLYDYKKCSTWVGKLKDPKVEWVLQLNLLRLGFSERGLNAVALRIAAFYRDWTKLDAGINSRGNYPQAPIQIIPIPMYDLGKTKQYLQRRIKLFNDCKILSDAELPECTTAERWGKDDYYAVVHFKDGVEGKAASGGGYFTTAEQADNFRKTCPSPEKKKVQFREGSNKRCDGHCPVRRWCSRFNVIDVDPF